MSKAYLGWGWVGTPKGRQQVDCGTNKQFQISFDLEQTLGGCLSEPMAADFTKPLFMLRHQHITENDVLGLAMYLPSSEINGYRSGNYLASFVTTCNTISDATALLSCVQALGFEQFSRLVDKNTRAYTKILNDEQPSEVAELDEIATKLEAIPQNLLQIQHKSDSLYIACQEKQVPALLKALLDSGLFYRYNRIYFSENADISAKVKNKQIEQMSADQIIAGAAFTKPYQDQLLHSYDAYHRLNDNFEQMKAHQATLVQQQVEQQSGLYIQQTQQVQQELQAVQNELNSAKSLAELGSMVMREVSNRATTLGIDDLAHFSTPQKYPSSELMDIQTQLRQLNLKLQNQSQLQSAEIEVEEVGLPMWITAVLAGLAIAFLGSTLWFALFSSISDQDIKKSSIYNKLSLELEQTKQDLEKAKQIKVPTIDVKAEYERGKADLRNEICSNNPKQASQIAITGNQKLCPDAPK